VNAGDGLVAHESGADRKRLQEAGSIAPPNATGAGAETRRIGADSASAVEAATPATARARLAQGLVRVRNVRRVASMRHLVRSAIDDGLRGRGRERKSVLRLEKPIGRTGPTH
jgi:hypothetical protein